MSELFEKEINSIIDEFHKSEGITNKMISECSILQVRAGLVTRAITLCFNKQQAKIEKLEIYKQRLSDIVGGLN